MLDQIFVSGKEKEEVTFKKVKSSEKPMRSIVKAVSWRVLGTIDTMIIAWFFVRRTRTLTSVAQQFSQSACISRSL